MLISFGLFLVSLLSLVFSLLSVLLRLDLYYKGYFMKLNKFSANCIIVLITIIWGSGFIFTKYCINAGMEGGLINVIRGGIFCLLTVLFFNKKLLKMSKSDIKTGLIAGTINGAAFVLQGLGLSYASASTSAFLTILYIVMVPFVAWLFYKRRPKIQIIPAIIIALIGTIVLTGTSFDGFGFGKGEWLTLGGTVLFALDIAYLGQASKDTSAEIMSFWMGLMQAMCGLVVFLIFETTTLPTIDWSSSILPLLYLGVVGTFMTTVAQVFCQKVTDETSASMIMTLEAVFGSAFSLILGMEAFSYHLLIGGILIFIGVLIALADFARVKAGLTKLSIRFPMGKDKDNL